MDSIFWDLLDGGDDLASGKTDEKRKPSDELLAVLAKNIKTLRQERKLTQEKLSWACDFHPTFVSMVERKQRNVTISTLEIFANALGVEAFELLKHRDDG